MAGYRIKPKVEKAFIYKADPRAIVPVRQSEEAAGYDLHCMEDFSLGWNERITVSTGLVIQPPPGFHFEILPRSGLAYKHGIFITNNVGLIDRDYAGPSDVVHIMLCRPEIRNFKYDVELGLRSHKDEDSVILFKAGDRVAQLIFRETVFMEFEEVDQAPKGKARGGLGSTGLR
jgi:dUTP pyrophosphatase